MDNKQLSYTKKLYELIQNDISNTEILEGVCFELGDITNSNVIVLDKKGKIITSKMHNEDKILFDVKMVKGVEYIENQLNEQLKNIVETKVNAELSSFYIKNTPPDEIKKYTATFLPISAVSERIGTLILYSDSETLSTDSIVMSEFSAIMISLIMKHTSNENSSENKRKIDIVKSAIGTLSYSELEAILHIFDELKGLEGLLIASQIADKAGITRSVIVNALRKFESAGVIESRSLGMKGTYIKVLNELLLDELNKLRN